MKRKNTVKLPLVTLAAVLIGLVLFRTGTGRAMPRFRESANVALLPSREDIQLVSLPATALPADPNGVPKVTAAAALNVVETRFGFSDSQVDSSSGLVSAIISLRRDALHQNIKARVIPFVIDIPGQGPRPGSTMYQRLCVVVDATTGKFVFAYAADPSVTTHTVRG